VLLKEDPPTGWEVVWPTCQSNATFAGALFSRFAIDPYSSATTRLVTGLRENELAELQIWLYQHHLKQNEDDGIVHLGPRTGEFTAITSNRGWHWLSMAVMSNLIERGTPAAREAIHRIQEAAPDVNLDRADKAAEEVVRQKTWEPLSPSEFLDFALASRRDSEQPPDKAPSPDRARKSKMASRRNQRYEAIDAALRQIAESRPRSQEEVFGSLQRRHVVTPLAQPFLAAGGWMAGFKRDKTASRAWLSKRWAELELRSLPRGPKKTTKVVAVTTLG
jgi:hypothetical protein